MHRPGRVARIEETRGLQSYSMQSQRSQSVVAPAQAACQVASASSLRLLAA
jgi:hypothetical protein